MWGGGVAGGSQGRVFGRDWSEFAEQGVVGAVSNPMLRAQESSRSVTIRSVCILLEPVSLSTQVLVRVSLDHLRWASWLDEALLPVLQVTICFANCVFSVSILRPTPTWHSPAPWLPAGPFFFHRPAGRGVDLSPRSCSCSHSGHQGAAGSVREPGT